MSDDRLFRTSPLRRAGASSFVPGPFSPSPFLFWSPTAAFAPFSWTQHARGCAFSLGSVVLWSSVSNGSNRWDGREGGGSPKNRSTGKRRATRTLGFQPHPPRDMVIVSRIDGEDRPLPAEDPCAGVESGHLLSSSACDARHNGSVLRGRGRSRTRPVHRSDKNRDPFRSGGFGGGRWKASHVSNEIPRHTNNKRVGKKHLSAPLGASVARGKTWTQLRPCNTSLLQQPATYVRFISPPARTDRAVEKRALVKHDSAFFIVLLCRIAPKENSARVPR
eukprot:scaffold622_cov335-Pavlova_lutheri.AAC.5